MSTNGRPTEESSESVWYVIIREAYDSAVAAYSSDPNSHIPFWCLPVELSAIQMSAAAAAVARNAIARSHRNEKETLVFLLSLLRSHLRTVRANRLWPEVAAELGKAGGVTIDAGACGQHFRALLDRTSSAEISRISHHNKYVIYLLDEAGIGHDRARIVTDFFRHVARNISTVFVDDAPEQIAHQLLAEFLNPVMTAMTLQHWGFRSNVRRRRRLGLLGRSWRPTILRL